ncbi:KinB sensor domain-containing domain [Pseudomonas alcaligenes]|uniref:KinB sensor domain-containing domain n=1 Tax=Pseudomonas sp. RIT-PI-AD TaxID=3035294 RepID=UPI0021DAC910
MALPMTLRTRLFLSISALITVALFGLLLGLISVMQMAKSQEQLIRYNFVTFEISQSLRQQLGDQLVNLMARNPQPQALEQSQEHFRKTLVDGIATAPNEPTRQRYQRISEEYEAFLAELAKPGAARWSLQGDNDLSQAFDTLRQSMLEVHRLALDNITEAEARDHDRAFLIATLLSVMGIAVLLIGFATAHGIARRFGGPIEALAKAADQIGKGDLQVSLPDSPVHEMDLLSRRFGLMAESLRELKTVNVEKLLAEQKRLQAVLDSIDDGLLILDRLGQVEHANPVARRQLNWNDDHLGQPLGLALDHPELDDLTRQVLGGALIDEAPPDLVIEAEGETRLLSWRLTPVNLGEGRPLGAVMVLRDVTEQRAFERVRNEFMLRASHELRTPVTGMQMAFGLLRERLVYPEESREADLLVTVDAEMQRLVRLITDLLNFSRYQNGLQSLEMAPCALDTLLEQVRDRFAGQATERSIHIEMDLHQPLPRVNLDRGQIERVFDNLLGNALRHTPDGGTIRLQARRHGDRVIMSVEDNGDGIATSQQARIFEPFVQVSSKKGGAGLGLALCKEIVQLHGGRIGVYSRPGQGAQFYMALPL